MKNNYYTTSNACRDLKISEIITIDYTKETTDLFPSELIILSLFTNMINNLAKHI